MNRRDVLARGGALGTAIVVSGVAGRLHAQGATPDPAPYGGAQRGIVHDSPAGKVIASDSLLGIYDASVTPNEVVIAGSYCGAANLPHAIRQGVRGFIAHDAGVGLNDAGIGALPLGDQRAIPVAAVENLSAEVSNGRSMAQQGVVSFANQTAAQLGVTPGMPALEAAILMLNAPLRQPSEAALPLDHSHRVMIETASGLGLASSAATNFPEGDRHINDVLAFGSHMGAIAVPILTARRFKGCIGNDCGKARNDSGIASLPLLNGLGILAASVGTMTARIGDGDSTWNDGRISAANDLARAAGVTTGMPAAEAARLMLLA